MRSKEKKMPAGLTPEFLEEVAQSNVDSIKAKIVLIQKGIEESKAFKKENEAVIQAKQEALSLVQPANEVIRAGSNRIKYLYDALKALGEP